MISLVAVALTLVGCAKDYEEPVLVERKEYIDNHHRRVTVCKWSWGI